VAADFDSTADTLKHSLRVGELMGQPISELVDRSVKHDLSKTQDPELAVFNEFTPKLKDITYGSEEYRACLAEMQPALDHHYAANRHHPEHFTDGVNGMTLVDLVEMLADWKAATERHADGSLDQSLRIQRERFGLSDQLLRILRNTASYYGWADGEVCGVAGRAPNGDTLSCNLPAGLHEQHCDGLRDGMWWRDGEPGGFEGGQWRYAGTLQPRPATTA
jgi:hypothetical protein